MSVKWSLVILRQKLKNHVLCLEVNVQNKKGSSFFFSPFKRCVLIKTDFFANRLMQYNAVLAPKNLLKKPLCILTKQSRFTL